MRYILFLLWVAATISSRAQSQLNHKENNSPVVDYVLIVSEKDLSSYNVSMHIKNAPDTFRVAMVKHFEYNDRFWRYIKDLKVMTDEGEGSVERLDSALWKINTNNNEAVISYRIQLPAAQGWRGSWKPFLSTNGGLVGGPHSFLYVVGFTQLHSHITINLPINWTIATGLVPTVDSRTFYASSVYMLTDEPILIGDLHNWMFTIDGVPHRICYSPAPNAKSFDTAALITGIKKISQQAEAIFKNFPYRDFTFQLIDGTYGGLEHANSVTLGINSSEVSENFKEVLEELAHEYFHTWNLVRIRPAEYGDVTYENTLLAKELWWSEGVTMFYADLLLRRAGLPVYDSTRIKHLEKLISHYFSSAGNNKISPEKVSMAANADEGMLGDYSASTHLQGELLGAMLDLIIRSATGNKKSLDDVMRWMMEYYSKGKGFTNKDIEHAVTAICGCSVHSFFNEHIYGSDALDFNVYLALIGLHMNIEWTDALKDDGTTAPDLRVYAWPGKKGNLLLGITDPQSVWGKAGLHTGDEILAINDEPVITQRDFFDRVRKEKIGNIITIRVRNVTGVHKRKVVIEGYKMAFIKIAELQNAADQQRRLRQQWINVP